MGRGVRIPEDSDRLSGRSRIETLVILSWTIQLHIAIVFRGDRGLKPDDEDDEDSLTLIAIVFRGDRGLKPDDEDDEDSLTLIAIVFRGDRGLKQSIKLKPFG